MLPEYFGYLAIPISLISILIYITDIFSGKVKPNRVTWLFWGIAPLIATYIEYKSGVAVPFIVTTFMSGAGCIFVFFVAIFHKSAYWKITIFDIVCGIISGIAIVVWVITKDGIISLVFAILADLAAGIPTIIKSWKHSETETIAPYALGIFNVITTLCIIKDFSFVNISSPVYIALANSIIVLGIQKNNLKHSAFI